MVTLMIGFLVAGASVFIVWLLGFSQEEVEKIEDLAKNSSVVIVTEEVSEVEGKSQNISPSLAIKFTINNESKDGLPYAQLWRYPVQSKNNFRWPEEAATLVDIQKRREGVTQLSMEMRLKLKDMGILRETAGEHQVVENLAHIARDTGVLMPRKNLWVSFDTFSAKSRPGLAQSSEDEDGSSLKVIANQQKKKKKLEETAKKNVKIIEWKNKHTDLFQQEKEKLIKFVREENQAFVRGF